MAVPTSMPRTMMELGTVSALDMAPALGGGTATLAFFSVGASCSRGTSTRMGPAISAARPFFTDSTTPTMPLPATWTVAPGSTTKVAGRLAISRSTRLSRRRSMPLRILRISCRRPSSP